MTFKKIMMTILTVVSLVTMGFAQQRKASEVKFEITGSQKYTDVKLLIYREWPERKLMDTLRLAAGKQLVRIKDSLPAVYTISTRKPYANETLIIEPNGSILIDFNESGNHVKGGSLQTEMQNHQLLLAPLEKKWQELGNLYTSEKDMEKKIVIEKETGIIAGKVNDSRLNFIKQNSSNVLGAWMADHYAYAWSAQSLDVLMPLFRNHQWAKSTYDKLASKRTEQKGMLMTGKKAPLFVLKSLKGGTASLDGILKKNEYVLIDVWASWCTPCRSANRKLAPVYAGLKKKGIEFVSVSVDDNLEAWKKAVQADKIPWMQLLSDDAMKGKFVEEYKVKSLPTTFLVNKEGIIIQQNVHVEDLEKLITQKPTTAVLLKNATIIDGDAVVKPRIGSLLIENGIIKTISFEPVNQLSADTKVIDCTGKFVTPGLMDSHVHLATADLSDVEKARLSTDSILVNLLKHGITTVRDMAGNAPYLAYYKSAIDNDKVPGPDIYYAAQFAGPGYFEMMGNGRKGEKDIGNTAWYKAINQKSEVKQAITDARKAGVTGIKIYADLSKELIREITEEAHKQGLLAWAHGAIFPSKPMDVATAGVNSMSHANDLVFQQIKGDTIAIGAAWAQLYKGLKLDSNVRDQLLREMKKHNTFLDPTVFHAENNKMANAALITRRAHQLGVKIVTGTDWIYPTKDEPVPLLDEMKLLTSKCGMTNLEVIQAATLNGALVAGLKDRGVLRTGKRADLLILDMDPQQNIDALFTPHAVFKKGKMVFQRK